MSVQLFEGPAGTGKTYQLRSAATQALRDAPLEDGQKILGLTKYHGSRQRMHSTFESEESLAGLADCVTFDAFARGIARRWRRLAQSIDLTTDFTSFTSISNSAATLLSLHSVSNWVSSRYPLVIVDEMQDCKSSEVRILSGLSAQSRLLCAADKFQDLSGDGSCEPVTWARSVGTVTELNRIYRTSSYGLLNAALCLRDNHRLDTGKQPGLEIVAVPAYALAGFHLSWAFRKLSANHREVVILSPNAPERSSFVRKAVDWSATKPAIYKRTGNKAGPFTFRWEADLKQAREAAFTALMLPDDPKKMVNTRQTAAAAREASMHDVAAWLEGQLRSHGCDELRCDHVTERMDRIISHRRAFARSKSAHRTIMTINQAKNREFDAVIVLWSREVRKKSQRRLLYNAITRAKHSAVVIVHGEARLEAPPFTPD